MNTIATPDAPTLVKRQRELLRRRLEVERRDTELSMNALANEVASVQTSRHSSPTDDEHDPEGPTLAFEQSQSSALLKQARARIGQIDDALERLDSGTYGVCTNCHTPISYARLGARPYAAHCITCAGKLAS
jgi:DnaK suppressor protein